MKVIHEGSVSPTQKQFRDKLKNEWNGWPEQVPHKLGTIPS